MNIAKLGRDLMITEPFYGLYLLNLNKIFSKEVPTLAVGLNGINQMLYINEEYMASLNPKEQLAVFKHEMLHICMQHLMMRNSFDNKILFNVAADIEINQYIENLPKNALRLNTFDDILLPPKAGTKIYYELLEENLKSNNPNKFLKDLVDDSDYKLVHITWDEYEQLSDAEKKLIESQTEYILKECATQIHKSRGTIPGELSTLIEELFKIKESIFNWKVYFRRLLGNSFNIFTKKSLRKISKRFEDNAGIKIKKKHNVLVAIDTSGSVKNEELLDFFSEIYHIYKAGTTITIIECDASIKRIYEYNGTFNGEIVGRGGTNFEPVIDYYNQYNNQFTTLIYFTDGYAPFEKLKPKKKMIWIISSNGNNSNDYPGYIIRIPKNGTKSN